MAEVDNPFVFVAGVPRSGTTLLRNLLAAQPELAIPHESEWVLEVAFALSRHRRLGDVELAWRMILNSRTFRRWNLDVSAVEERLAVDPPHSYAELVSALYSFYAAANGKRWAGDRTPKHGRWFSLLADLFPKAKFVHIVRDPRAVAMSLAVQPFHHGDLVGAARQWSTFVAAIDAARPSLSSRFVEVRYEALAADPMAELETICAALGLLAPAPLGDLTSAGNLRSSVRHRSSVQTQLRDWRTELSTADIGAIESVAGRVMRAKGYETLTRGSLRHAPRTVRSRLVPKFQSLVQPRSRWSAPPDKLGAVPLLRSWRPVLTESDPLRAPQR